MLNKIIQMSLANRLIVLVGSVLLMVFGFIAISKMEVDVFPDLSAPTVVVMTEAEGMAPEEVERMVTFPIETVLNGATDVRRVRSSSTTGFSVVWVEFDWDTDIYLARQIVAEKLSIVREQFPDGVGEPTLGPQSSILGEMMIIGLTADSTTLMDLRTLADWTIRPRLLSVGGVSQVSILGGDIKEYQINLDPLRMKHYGVTIDDVLAATEGLTHNTSGGTFYDYGNEYIVRCLLSDFSIEQLGHAVVMSKNGSSILLENIATVKIGAKFPKLGVASDKAKDAVLITVTKQPNTGTIELTEKLEYVLKDLQKNLPADVTISTDIFKQSTFIESSIDNVKDALVEGGILVAIVLFLFLMNVRTTLISLITIPLSVMITFVVLSVMGLSINTMSLGGVAIAIGSLVDDAIVDVENIYKRLRENALLPKSEQFSKLEIVFMASKEVRMPILNSTMIIVATFLPLFFLSGMEGRMLVPLGISFVVSLFASTIVALTLTPVLSSYLLQPTDKENSSDPSWVVKMKKMYQSLLQKALSDGKPILTGVTICFVLSLLLFAGFGRSFLPSFNEGSFTINVSTIPGISLEESDKIGRMAEEALLSVPEIVTVGRKTGRSELDEHALGVNVSELEAPFVLSNRSKREVEHEVRQKLNALPGVNVEIGSPISHRIDAMLSGTRANIAIKVFGDDLSKLYEVAGKIKNTISQVEGVADLMVEQQVERPQLKILPRREMLVKYGVTIPQFSSIVETFIAGKVVSEVYEGSNNYDLVLRADSSYRGDINSIKEMLVDANGMKVPFHDLVNVVSSMGPNTINRENVARRIVVSANVVDRDLRSVVKDIQHEIDENISLPEGYYVQYGGQFESEQAASRIIMLASIISILLIFWLLYREFRAVNTTMVVLLNLPLALIGGVVSVALMGGVLSIPALIGFISLFGIATRNGMLLIDRYDTLLSKGNSLEESIIQGSLDRLNPILMTALTSGLALIPLALGGDLPGNEIQSPMAKVILGGLITSTLLNAFVVPISYMLIRKRKNTKNNI